MSSQSCGKQKGSLLIELLIAMGVFILGVSVIAFLIIDAYVSDRLGKELTQATLLAEEGLEVARDTGFSSVVSIAPEIIDKFTRTITVTSIDADRKQVTSKIAWDLTDLRPEVVILNTYLTNWEASVSGVYNYIYAFRGNKKKDFWRYSISANSWTAMSNAPDNVDLGGDLAYDGDDYIYALRGDNKKDFWRYTISTDSWSVMTDALENVKNGGSLVYDDSNYIYGLRGNKKKDFWRYDISGDSWLAMTDTPAKIKDGGSIVHDQADYIYAFRGGNKSDFWRYSILGDSWTAITSTLANVDAGGDLVLGTGPVIVPDTTPPADISDLALSGATAVSINLGWTAPGDDGSTGTATTYDIRYSTSVITLANWGSATQVAGEPSPSAAGSSESMTVSGLSASTLYYFAIRTSDEVPNESGLSNVPSLATIVSQADDLVIDISGANIGGGGNKELKGITVQNTGASDLTIAKITVTWDNAQLIEEIKIEGTKIWKHNNEGSPNGKQPSGIEIDVVDYVLHIGDTDGFDKFKFNGNMTGVTFSITIEMSDGSTKSTGNFTP